MQRVCFRWTLARTSARSLPFPWAVSRRAMWALSSEIPSFAPTATFTTSGRSASALPRRTIRRFKSCGSSVIRHAMIRYGNKHVKLSPVWWWLLPATALDAIGSTTVPDSSLVIRERPKNFSALFSTLWAPLSALADPLPLVSMTKMIWKLNFFCFWPVFPFSFAILNYNFYAAKFDFRSKAWKVQIFGTRHCATLQQWSLSTNYSLFVEISSGCSCLPAQLRSKNPGTETRYHPGIVPCVFMRLLDAGLARRGIALQPTRRSLELPRPAFARVRVWSAMSLHRDIAPLSAAIQYDCNPLVLMRAQKGQMAKKHAISSRKTTWTEVENKPTHTIFATALQSVKRSLECSAKSFDSRADSPY